MGIQPAIIDRASRIYILLVSIIHTHFLLGPDYLCSLRFLVYLSRVYSSMCALCAWGRVGHLGPSSPISCHFHSIVIRWYDHAISFWCCSRWTENPSRSRPDGQEVIRANTCVQIVTTSEMWDESRVCEKQDSGTPGTKAGFSKTASDKQGYHFS